MTHTQKLREEERVYSPGCITFSKEHNGICKLTRVCSSSLTPHHHLRLRINSLASRISIKAPKLPKELVDLPPPFFLLLQSSAEISLKAFTPLPDQSPPPLTLEIQIALSSRAIQPKNTHVWQPRSFQEDRGITACLHRAGLGPWR